LRFTGHGIDADSMPVAGVDFDRGRRSLHSDAADMTTTSRAPAGATCGATWRQMGRRLAPLLLAALIAPNTASAQDKGTLNPQPLPPLAHPDDPKTPAKELFGRKAAPAALQSRTIGFYAKGCLAGAEALPINGRTWQVMRLSRNRNWGHPNLVAFLERLADQAPKTGWHGLLLGDMSQPRGGPMMGGHASHQVGLDADIWLTPMPDREFTRLEREEMSATMIVRDDRKDVDPKVWTPAHTALIKAAAQDTEVARIFVNAAIKKALCRDAGTDRAWLSKVQPWWGHDWHFHVRLKCPADSPECKPQDPRPPEEGCGKALDHWFTDAELHPKPDPKPPQPRVGPKMSELPPACRQVLLAP
jgi:penicillin-insensitive murein DD-endopeptidase